MESFPYPIPKHRRPRPHIRRHNGNDVRPGGIPLDCAWHNFRRCRPRLCRRHDFTPLRRHITPRNRRQRAWKRHKTGNARVFSRAAHPCRGGLRCHHLRSYSIAYPRKPQPHFLGGSDIHLLPAGNNVPHRQTDREHLPPVRRRAAVHGGRPCMGDAAGRCLHA